MIWMAPTSRLGIKLGNVRMGMGALGSSNFEVWGFRAQAFNQICCGLRGPARISVTCLGLGLVHNFGEMGPPPSSSMGHACRLFLSRWNMILVPEPLSCL